MIQVTLLKSEQEHVGQTLANRNPENAFPGLKFSATIACQHRGGFRPFHIPVLEVIQGCHPQTITDDCQSKVNLQFCFRQWAKKRVLAQSRNVPFLQS